MEKKEAVKEWVDRTFSGIPTEWVQTLVEHKGLDVYAWPMWGTMWIMEYHGEELYENARTMLHGAEELEEEVARGDKSDYTEEEREKLTKAIKEGDWMVLGEYINEEMAGERCVLDKDGETTAAYIYEIEGKYVLGIHGAGWNFYDGVWDKIYDALGIKWHERV